MRGRSQIPIIRKLVIRQPSVSEWILWTSAVDQIKAVCGRFGLRDFGDINLSEVLFSAQRERLFGFETASVQPAGTVELCPREFSLNVTAENKMDRRLKAAQN